MRGVGHSRERESGKITFRGSANPEIPFGRSGGSGDGCGRPTGPGGAGCAGPDPERLAADRPVSRPGQAAGRAHRDQAASGTHAGSTRNACACALRSASRCETDGSGWRSARRFESAHFAARRARSDAAAGQEDAHARPELPHGMTIALPCVRGVTGSSYLECLPSPTIPPPHASAHAPRSPRPGRLSLIGSGRP